jgi:hypothetical protein
MQSGREGGGRKRFVESIESTLSQAPLSRLAIAGAAPLVVALIYAIAHDRSSRQSPVPLCERTRCTQLPVVTPGSGLAHPNRRNEKKRGLVKPWSVIRCLTIDDQRTCLQEKDLPYPWQLRCSE